jgi:hypothetical protein
MRSLVVPGMLVLSIGVLASVAGAATLEISPKIVHEINVTADSSPGWIPTADQRQLAIKAVQVFLDAVESGRYAEAYALLAELQKSKETLAQFTQAAKIPCSGRTFKVLESSEGHVDKGPCSGSVCRDLCRRRSCRPICQRGSRLRVPGVVSASIWR